MFRSWGMGLGWKASKRPGKREGSSIWWGWPGRLRTHAGQDRRIREEAAFKRQRRRARYQGAVP